MSDENLINEKQLDNLKETLLRAMDDMKEYLTNQIKDSKEEQKGLREKYDNLSVKVARLETTLLTYRNSFSILLGLLVVIEFILRYVKK